MTLGTDFEKKFFSYHALESIAARYEEHMKLRKYINESMKGLTYGFNY